MTDDPLDVEAMVRWATISYPDSLLSNPEATSKAWERAYRSDVPALAGEIERLKSRVAILESELSRSNAEKWGRLLTQARAATSGRAPLEPLSLGALYDRPEWQQSNGHEVAEVRIEDVLSLLDEVERFRKGR